MILMEVLEAFDKDTNSHIEQIEYDESDNNFIVEVTTYDKESDLTDFGAYSSARVGLCSNGTTYEYFKYIENNQNENGLYVMPELIDLIIKIRKQWKAFAESHKEELRH